MTIDLRDVALGSGKYTGLRVSHPDPHERNFPEAATRTDPAVVSGVASAMVNRFDACELAAAFSMLAEDSCDLDRLHVPTIAKMARGKSDSGVDAFDVALLAVRA